MDAPKIPMKLTPDEYLDSLSYVVENCMQSARTAKTPERRVECLQLIARNTASAARNLYSIEVLGEENSISPDPERLGEIVLLLLERIRDAQDILDNAVISDPDGREIMGKIRKALSHE